MTRLVFSEYKPGRRIIARLPHGQDLITGVEALCKAVAVHMATFTIIGSISSATVGTYDQAQQVYATCSREDPFDIVGCVGNISLKKGRPAVSAQIVLADINGKISGGHLFSETLIFAAEIDLLELTGKPLERAYDKTTGLWLWQPSP